MEERLIEIFKEYLPAWSWEEWQAAGASDKEDIVINALADLGPDMPIEVDEAYDLFWDWAAGLTEADFGRKITESTAEDPYGYGPYKVPTDPKLAVGDYIKAKRYSSDTKWYPARVTRITPDFVDYTISGFGFIKNGTAVRSASAKQAFGNLRKRLLGEACDSNLDETSSPEEKARVAAENEARFAKLAELEAERAARAKERSKQLAIQVAENAIAKGVIDEYNKYWRRSILGANSIRPAIDPETKELVFDRAEQRRILDPIRQQIEAEKTTKKEKI